MIIVCPTCDARYNLVQPIAPPGRKVRCRKCTHVWWAEAHIAQPPGDVAGSTAGDAPALDPTGARGKALPPGGLIAPALQQPPSRMAADLPARSPQMPPPGVGQPGSRGAPVARRDVEATLAFPFPPAPAPAPMAPAEPASSGDARGPSSPEPASAQWREATFPPPETGRNAPPPAPAAADAADPAVQPEPPEAALSRLTDRLAQPPLSVPPADQSTRREVDEPWAFQTPAPTPASSQRTAPRQPQSAPLAQAHPAPLPAAPSALAPAPPPGRRGGPPAPSAITPPPAHGAQSSPPDPTADVWAAWPDPIAIPAPMEQQGRPAPPAPFPPGLATPPYRGTPPGFRQPVGPPTDPAAMRDTPAPWPDPVRHDGPPSPAPHRPISPPFAPHPAPPPHGDGYGHAPMPHGPLSHAPLGHAPPTAPNLDADRTEGSTPHGAKDVRRKRSWLSIAASLLVIAAAAGLIAFLVVERNFVARSVPGSAGLYGVLGMSVNQHGLALRNVKVDWVEEDNQADLEVRGEIHNLLQQERRVPSVVVTIRDRSGASLYHTVGTVGSGLVSRGGFTRFTARIATPPPGVASVAVHFPAPK